MEERKKKPIMIAVIVVCFAAAGAIAWKFTFSPKGKTGIETLKPGRMIWVKCRNPDCEAAYQMDEKEYFMALRERQDPMSMTASPLICKECGEESVYGAVKCAKCGLAFERGAVPNDFADRCPECGYSATEEARKARAEERARRTGK